VLFAHVNAFTLPIGGFRDFIGRHGAYGVDLFFVISGYIITALLLKSKGEPRYFHDFYIRRAQRILPLYAIFVATCFLITFWRIVPQLGDMRTFLLYPLFLQNALPAFGLPMMSPTEVTWSLCVEEHFYLIWPVLVWKLSPRSLRTVCLAAIAVSLVTRYVCWTSGWYIVGMFSTPAKLDGLALGALISLGWSPATRPGIAALTCGLVAFLLLYVGQFGVAAVVASDKLVFSLLFFLLVAFRSSLQSVLSARWLVYVGQRSYGLYLIHAVVFYVLSNKLGLYGWVFVPVALGCTFSLAELSWRYLEAPILALRLRPAEALVANRTPVGLAPGVAA
jgi:peptidoglycan/LPS O-acetylase OafA/YrhL